MGVPYHGPVVVLTVEEGAQLLRAVPLTPDWAAIRAKLEEAVNANPLWRTPLS